MYNQMARPVKREVKKKGTSKGDEEKWVTKQKTEEQPA
jgi:hypothetical protein